MTSGLFILWPKWLTDLLSLLPTTAVLQERLNTSSALNLALNDENASLRDDIRQRDKTIKGLEQKIDQLCPGNVDPVGDLLIRAISRYGEDYVEAETMAEWCGINRYEIRLRLAPLVDAKYVGLSDQSRYYLTRKALLYLQREGEFNELEGDPSTTKAEG